MGISSPKLGKNDLFTMTKHRICWYIGLHSWLNRVKFSFLDNSKHSKFCFRKKQFLAISRQFSSVNFENPCQTKIKQIWKGKHFNYSRVKDELKIKTYFQRQSRAKYIGNLLGSTENLILIRRERLALHFVYFRQDNCKTEFLATRLDTRLHFEYFISFHPNSLISSDPKLKS